MFAIIFKADGLPVRRQAGGDQPDMVVTWTSKDKASAFLSAKGIQSDYQVVALTEDTLGSMAKALGCEPDSIAFDAYPG
jgi:hypothetical protein